MYAIRTRSCGRCGQPVTGRISPTKEVRCLDCNVNALTTNSRQMYEKAGPGYDRWLKSAGPRGRPRKPRSE